MVKNPPASAGDVGLILDLGRSHMPRSNWAHVSQLLSLCSTAREPQLLKSTHPRACAPQQEKSLQWEAVASLQESSARSSDDPAQSKHKPARPLTATHVWVPVPSNWFTCLEWHQAVFLRGSQDLSSGQPRLWTINRRTWEFAVYQICPSWLWHPVLFHFSP